LQGFGDRQTGVSGAFAYRDVDGLAGGRQYEHCATVAAVCGGAEGAHRGGLARAPSLSATREDRRRPGASIAVTAHTNTDLSMMSSTTSRPLSTRSTM
jgi:hypothetical protein